MPVSAADARAERARRSAQPSNKEGREDPTLETPLKDTGLPPSPPSPPIDGRSLSDLEAWTRWLRSMDRVAQLLPRLGPVALPRIGKEERKEALEEFRKGKGKSGGARGEGASDKRPMPDVKAKRAEYMQQYRARPEVKANKVEYGKQYYARPEVKANRARPEVKEKRAEYKNQYRARPEVKSNMVEYDNQYNSMP